MGFKRCGSSDVSDKYLELEVLHDLVSPRIYPRPGPALPLALCSVGLRAPRPLSRQTQRDLGLFACCWLGLLACLCRSFLAALLWLAAALGALRQRRRFAVGQCCRAISCLCRWRYLSKPPVR